MKVTLWHFAALSILLAVSKAAYEPQCGSQRKNNTCPSSLCCSQSGFCGQGSYYCGTGCQSQCGSPEVDIGSRNAPVNNSVQSIITKHDFNSMFKHTGSCRTDGFYTYDSFITSLQSFKNFGTTGDVDTKKREIAAFFAQISHETTGGWLNAIDGPFSWGFCIVSSPSPDTFCNPATTQWPCAPGKKYYGRGPLQLKYNNNYGEAGKALGLDLLQSPDLVATNPVVSFRTALWFWTTEQAGKPSAHDVMTGIWKPSAADQAAGRVPGFGATTNIFNGVFECGHGSDLDEDDRIGFYKRYCDILGVSYGTGVECGGQKPF